MASFALTLNSQAKKGPRRTGPKGSSCRATGVPIDEELIIQLGGDMPVILIARFNNSVSTGTFTIRFL